MWTGVTTCADVTTCSATGIWHDHALSTNISDSNKLCQFTKSGNQSVTTSHDKVCEFSNLEIRFIDPQPSLDLIENSGRDRNVDQRTKCFVCTCGLPIYIIFPARCHLSSIGVEEAVPLVTNAGMHVQSESSYG